MILLIIADTYFIICDALQEKFTYVGKMSFEFSAKSGSGHPCQHVPEEYKAYCLIESIWLKFGCEKYEVWVIVPITRYLVVFFGPFYFHKTNFQNWIYVA